MFDNITGLQWFLFCICSIGLVLITIGIKWAIKFISKIVSEFFKSLWKKLTE